MSGSREDGSRGSQKSRREATMLLDTLNETLSRIVGALTSIAMLPSIFGFTTAAKPEDVRLYESQPAIVSQSFGENTIERSLEALVTEFPISLKSEDDRAILEGTIRRLIPRERVPVIVKYEPIFDNMDELSCYWVSEGQTSNLPNPKFLYLSNASTVDVSLKIEDAVGNVFNWEDTGIDIPLHNEIPITLDATQFVPLEQIAKVTWTAENGDPADAVTFPIENPNNPVTTLTSVWPNVLNIGCKIETKDGNVLEKNIEALIYFKDGTPFEIRSVAATVQSPHSLSDLDAILDKMFPLLRELGFNSVTTAINWWFGSPDEDGNWLVHPIYEELGLKWHQDPRGITANPELLERYVARAKAEGFQVHIELRQFPYQNDPQLQRDVWERYYPFRITDGFLYGKDGQGYLNMLMHYLPFFIEHNIDTVFLNAETGEFEVFGGEKMREFFRDVIAEYRAAGYQGAISYASGFTSDPVPMHRQNFSPYVCGIPWADMDYYGFTFYPKLAYTNDASTETMFKTMQSYIWQYLKPLSDLYDIPIFIEDCYCFEFDGCAVKPLVPNLSRVDLEEARRYHTSILRAFAHANLNSDRPLVKAITIGMYDIIPDDWFAYRRVEWSTAAPYVNDIPGRKDFRLLIKIYFSDKPLSD